MAEDNIERIGILITSYPAHRHYVPQCLDCLRASPWPAVFGWDGDEPPQFDFPPCVKKIYTTAGVKIVGRKFKTKGDRTRLHRAEKRLMMEGSKMLVELGCEYALKIAGDNTIRNVGRLGEVIGVMGKNDIVFHLDKQDLPSALDGTYKRINLNAIVYRLKPFLRIMEWHDFERLKARHGGSSGRLLEFGIWKGAKELDIRFAPRYEFFRKVLDFRHFYHCNKGSHKPEGDLI